jgi:predicted nucleic acid-binding protein
VARLTLDAGPAIAYERGDQEAVRLVDLALRCDVDLSMSAVTVAEVWRGGPRSARVAALLDTLEIVDVDEIIAKRAGVVLGEAASSNTLDALVVATAQAQRAAVVTVDVDDVAPLAAVAGVELRAF